MSANDLPDQSNHEPGLIITLEPTSANTAQAQRNTRAVPARAESRCRRTRSHRVRRSRGCPIGVPSRAVVVEPAAGRPILIDAAPSEIRRVGAGRSTGPPPRQGLQGRRSHPRRAAGRPSVQSCRPGVRTAASAVRPRCRPRQSVTDTDADDDRGGTGQRLSSMATISFRPFPRTVDQPDPPHAMDPGCAPAFPGYEQPIKVTEVTDVTAVTDVTTHVADWPPKVRRHARHAVTSENFLTQPTRPGRSSARADPRLSRGAVGSIVQNH